MTKYQCTLIDPHDPKRRIELLVLRCQDELPRLALSAERQQMRLLAVPVMRPR